MRHLLGIGFPGDSLGMDFMLGDVEIDWEVPRGMSVFAMVPRQDAAPDFLVVIPLPERNRYRVSMLSSGEPATAGTVENEHGISSERPGPPLEQLQDVADRLLPGKPRLSRMRWSSLFRISMRLADRYRVGNSFIVGDAAHIHPPTGGQGMNTGIQDAYNLAWKMAMVV
ncbi:FAD-dependent monooxygenase, partial [Rhizobiaceae sp. 2RAB30]